MKVVPLEAVILGCSMRALHGVRRLRFGKTTTDLLYGPATGSVIVISNAPYKLILNGKSRRIKSGENRIDL
jgi:hypothetical protein